MLLITVVIFRKKWGSDMEVLPFKLPYLRNDAYVSHSVAYTYVSLVSPLMTMNEFHKDDPRLKFLELSNWSNLKAMTLNDSRRSSDTTLIEVGHIGYYVKFMQIMGYRAYACEPAPWSAAACYNVALSEWRSLMLLFGKTSQWRFTATRNILLICCMSVLCFMTECFLYQIILQ